MVILTPKISGLGMTSNRYLGDPVISFN
ncbi:uncharacterized protein METZ01_LOCUS310844 [marine metagenome]|uniref:Uncharacterized protein n=1 Tax=marine metagenome TaxID=408172 RepID=A0A382KGK5_9ZZZZ